jgi:hypothetical protein
MQLRSAVRWSAAAGSPGFGAPAGPDARALEPLLLRDGTSAQVRVAQSADRDALHAFFGRQSPPRGDGGSSPPRSRPLN